MKTTPKLFLAALMLITGQVFAQTTATTMPVGITTQTTTPSSEVTQQVPIAQRDAATTPHSPKSGTASGGSGGNNGKDAHAATVSNPNSQSRSTTKHTKPPAKK